MSTRCLKRRVFWLAPSMINSNCSAQAQKFETIAVTWFSFLVPIPWSKDCRGWKMKKNLPWIKQKILLLLIFREKHCSLGWRSFCVVWLHAALLRQKRVTWWNKKCWFISITIVFEPEKLSVLTKVKAKWVNCRLGKYLTKCYGRSLCVANMLI